MRLGFDSLDVPLYNGEMTPKGWLTVSEAATRKGLDPQQIRDAIRRGNLAAERSGSIWLIREKDIDAFEPRGKGRPKRGRGRPKKSEK
jgi:excisionase family DNA binding protein